MCCEFLCRHEFPKDDRDYTWDKLIYENWLEMEKRYGKAVCNDLKEIKHKRNLAMHDSSYQPDAEESDHIISRTKMVFSRFKRHLKEQDKLV